MIAAVAMTGSYLCVKTIMYTCAKTLGLIYYMNQDDHFKEINQILLVSDIKKRVAKTHKLLTTMDNIHPAVCMCVQDLYETILAINTLLEQSLLIKQEHDKKYLSTWRGIQLPSSELNTQIQLFNIRFDDLVKITTIVHYLN